MRNYLLILIALCTGLLEVGAERAFIPPRICPLPKECEIDDTEWVTLSSVSIACGEAEGVEWAKRHLKAWYGKQAPRVEVASRYTSGLGKEAYALRSTDEGVEVDASTLQGLRYALYSLRQLAVAAPGTKTVSGWMVPRTVIRDEPRMAFRGMHICWFHETEPWEVERLIRLAAYYKLNYAVIESWGSFRSKVAPWYGWPDGTMTHREVHRLVKLAKDLGITLIPQINCFGHASMARGGASKHAGLDLASQYQSLFEPHNGWNWCLSNLETRKFLQALIAEQLEVFGNPPYFHIGCDEAELPSCPACIKQPYSQLLLNHIEALNTTIREHGAQAMMWHDMLLEQGDSRWQGFYANGTPETAAGFLKFPRDIIICDWYYGGAKEAYPTLDYFQQQGFQVLSCPWHDSGGIMAQGKYASRAGLFGMLGTLWHHYFGGSMTTAYFYLSNMAWNADGFIQAGKDLSSIATHLRQVGWDMGTKNPRHTGIYYDEIPPEPQLNN
ncbi:MAG: family 20 glycosylhydrolase [Bacteroidaceae bacterium]|nr:family 20 glycosylhydrolase [Bacteroidaceae bacterium]